MDKLISRFVGYEPSEVSEFHKAIELFSAEVGGLAEAWEYRLGTYSALEWILERYKDKKPKDPTIAEKFNTYQVAEYKEQVIDLLCGVCSVSVETMKIIKEMP